MSRFASVCRRCSREQDGRSHSQNAPRHDCSRRQVRFTKFADSLGAMSGHIDAPTAARASDALVAMLGDYYMLGPLRTELIDSAFIAEDLTKIAERLDAPGSLRTAEVMIPLVKKADKFTSARLSTAFVAVCRRLD